MKCNYKIYETETESDTKFIEESLVRQAKENFIPKAVIRPKVSVVKDVLKLSISAIIILILSVVLCVSNILSPAISLTFCIFIGIIWLIICVKRLIITMIILYQKYAPEYVRNSCVFEPCCSEYMKRAIVKYGTLKGLIKGIKRIMRCHYPNGGIDKI